MERTSILVSWPNQQSPDVPTLARPSMSRSRTDGWALSHHLNDLERPERKATMAASASGTRRLYASTLSKIKVARPEAWRLNRRIFGSRSDAMRIREAMTREVLICHPDQTIHEAARAMAGIDAGSLPVADNDRIVGMITDRDIAVRAVAQGRGPNELVRDVMTPNVCFCFEDQELDEVAVHMADNKVRRLPVISRENRLVGIVSLADIALCDDDPNGAADYALCGISEPGGMHSQAAATADCSGTSR
jgi:CBS domain-containing protein